VGCCDPCVQYVRLAFCVKKTGGDGGPRRGSCGRDAARSTGLNSVASTNAKANLESAGAAWPIKPKSAENRLGISILPATCAPFFFFFSAMGFKRSGSARTGRILEPRKDLLGPEGQVAADERYPATVSRSSAGRGANGLSDVNPEDRTQADPLQAARDTSRTFCPHGNERRRHPR